MDLRRNNRDPSDSDSRGPEFFLTDFIRLLRPKDDLEEFMEKGLKIRPFFEERTKWQLLLSGYSHSDRQILNVWRLDDSLDSIPFGLRDLATDPKKSTAFFDLLDLFDRESHFITHSAGTNSLKPKTGDEQTFHYVYVEYVIQYGKMNQFLNTFKVGLDTFAPPWQYIANVRAISGRVNTISQYWLRRAPKNADPESVSRDVRTELETARWEQPSHAEEFRRQRVDLLIPTAYDPLKAPRQSRQRARSKT
jgi:hypothetical protein